MDNKKRYFRSQNTGKLHESIDEYWLNICPICQTKLFWNTYSDKEVCGHGRDTVYQDGIYFDLKIEHCTKCNDWYVLIM